MESTRLAMLSLTIYRVLLALYPAAHRDDYGALMAQAFGDQCRATAAQGNTAWVGLWWRTVNDLALTLAIEHLASASRKVRIMQTVLFKNQPDRLAGLLFLLPGILLSLFYLITIDNGEGTGYGVAALVGGVGFALGLIKPLRRLRMWQSFALGVGLGLCLIVPLSPLIDGLFPALRAGLWPIVRVVAALAICVVLIGALGRGLPARWLALGVAGIVLGSAALALFVYGGRSGQATLLDSAQWTLSYTAAILGVVVLGRALAWRMGLAALLAVIVALGSVNALVLLSADVAQGKTPYGQITLALAYLIPLVIGPAWLLFAPDWLQKKRGLLRSWAALLAIVSLLLPLLDLVVEPHFFRAANPLDNVVYGLLFGLLTNLPSFIGLWLALALFERQSPAPDAAPTRTPESPRSEALRTLNHAS
ncbi:MAG: hypothetical protein IT320_03720 [Anaerolineae bacterium]|nr:hypothetical protein [Anaerolineae bacterium]